MPASGPTYTEVIIFKLVDESTAALASIDRKAKETTDKLKESSADVRSAFLKDFDAVAAARKTTDILLLQSARDYAKEATRIAKNESEEQKKIIAEMAAAAKEAEQGRLILATTVHNRIMEMKKEEANAGGGGGAASGVTVGQGLRVGAGLLGATGNFELAAGAYALERVADMAGVADVGMLALGASTIAVGAALAAVAAGAGLLFAGDKFTRELADMSTLLLDDSVAAMGFAQALDATASSAIRVSDRFNTDLIETVKGFKEALSSGIDAADLERFGNVAGEMARALGVNFTSASNILTSFRDAYSLTVGQLEHVNDVLFNVINLGKVNAQELQTNLGRVLPLAQQAGVSIEDLGAGIALLTRRGATASQAVTSLADIINKLQNPSKGSMKMMEELGIGFGKAAIEGKHFSEIIGNIIEKTGGDADVISKLFPDIRGKRGIASLVEGVDLLKKIESGMTASGTSAVAAARAMDSYGETIGRAFSQVWKDIQGVGRVVGTSGIKVFGDNQEDQIRHIQQTVIGLTGVFGLLVNTIMAVRHNMEDVALGDKMWADAIRASDQAIEQYKLKTVKAYDDVAHGAERAAKAHQDLADQATEKGEKIALAKFVTKEEKDQITELTERIDMLTAKTETASAALMRMGANESRAMSAKLGIPGLEADFKNAKSGVDLGQTKAALDAAYGELKGYMDEWTTKADNQINNGVDNSVKTMLQDQLNFIQDTVKNRTEAPYKGSSDVFAFLGLPPLKEVVKEAEAAASIINKMKEEAVKYGMKIYDDDEKNFEKFEKKKQDEVDKTLKKLEESRHYTEGLLRSIENDSMKAEMGAAGNDPRKQRNIAQGHMDHATEKVQAGLASGNIDQKTFDTLIKMIREAAGAKEGAMSREDKERAGKNKVEDDAFIKTLVEQFAKLEEKRGGDSLAADKAKQYKKITPQEAAKLGEKKAEDEMQRNLKVDAKFDVAFKTSLFATPEEKQALTAIVLECIQTALKDGNTYNPYGQSGR